MALSLLVGVAVGVGETSEEDAKLLISLQDEMKVVKAQIAELEAENAELRAQLDGTSL
jgi:hypothetical protein